MKNRNKIMLLAVSLLVVLVVPGCGNKKPLPLQEDEKLVADVNNCKITVEDFQNDAILMLSKKDISSDPEKAKEEFLDEIIAKKILLQEAQAKNFDKDKAFRKEIERYWEQALLKRLIKEKMQELLQKMSVRDDEIAKEYEKMKLEQGSKVEAFDKVLPSIRSDIRRKKVAEAFSQWMDSLKSRAKIKIYKDNLKNVAID